MKRLAFLPINALVLTLCLPVQAATLVWNEEFDETSTYPDADNWTYDVGGGGWGNEELEYYTDRRDSDANAYLDDGCLVIEARKETMGSCAYTSARILSAQSWTYGRFVIRAKLPSGDGTWPAIWMMPTDSVYGSWPDSGEIDIMEHLGKTEGVIHGTLHTEAYDQGSTITISTATSAFHEYRLDWTKTGIWMYVDDVQYVYIPNTTDSDTENASSYWPFDQRFHFILNLALGGWGGDVDDTALPAQMLVDYARVYSLDESDNGPSRYDGVGSDGFADNPLFGPLYVSFDPWVWSENLDNWVYAPTPPDESGEWVYIPREQ